jgi:hypothetical protein
MAPKDLSARAALFIFDCNSLSIPPLLRASTKYTFLHGKGGTPNPVTDYFYHPCPHPNGVMFA